jgi:hypothetical protein
MLRKTMFVLLAVALALVVAVPALADAPAEGLVVEGASVPGIALGFSRAQVQDAFGPPDSCQSVQVAGDLASCAYPVNGGGRVWVRYRGADGGDPSNSPYDVAYFIRWEEQVTGWTTTAGVNTMLARASSDAVIAAYPNGVITYNAFGSILEVKDYELGIQANWDYDFYTGTTTVSMAISAPSTPPPPREKLTRVASVELVSSKERGQRQVRALVRVEDDRTLAAPDAIVFATWGLPDGTALQVEDTTSSSGYAYFELLHASKGTYTLTVDDVHLAGHRFDRANSVLWGSVQAR